MKKFVLKSVAAAVGVGLSGVAAAQVVLDSATSTAVYKYASETTFATTQTLGGSLQAQIGVGVAFNKDVAAYLRFDLGNATFGSNPTLACTTASGSVTVTTAVVGGSNTYTVFAIQDFTDGIAAADVCTLTANATSGVVATNKNAITIRARLFESLTNALNPTDSNTLNPTTSAAKNFVTWAPAVSVTLSAGTNATAAVADQYKKFVLTPTNGTTATLGKVTTAVASGVRLAAGTDATFSDIVASTATTVAGDFSFVAGASDIKLNGVAATSLNTGKTSAAFGSILNSSGDSSLALTANGTSAIKAGSYTATVALTAKSGFTVTSPAASSVGTIVRDGNNLLIPLAQSASGYISRFSLVNRSSSDAAYTVTIIQEDGGTATLDSAAAVGTVKANSTKVVDLTGTVNALNGRGALLVTVEAAANTISGTYQITNRASGAVSNQSMISVSN
jgi:hypothetical protein